MLHYSNNTGVYNARYVYITSRYYATCNSEIFGSVYYFHISDVGRFLKRLIDNNEQERKVMKDVPGWIPGTYYGSPVYHNKSIWVDPNEEEFWAHCDPYWGYYKQRMHRHWH